MDQRTIEGIKERARRPIRSKRYSRFGFPLIFSLILAASRFWRVFIEHFPRRTFGEEKRPPKRLFTPEIKRFLKDWLIRRRDNPYPNRDEKKTLAIQTGLTYIQVCNWFANWRRKLKNAGKEPQRKTWGHLIKTYNSQVQGNVEHFSICSDDSIWHELEMISDYDHDHDESKTGEFEPTAYIRQNNNSDIQAQCFFISSTTENEIEENPFSQHKYKNHIMEKYLRDCQNPENNVGTYTEEITKPSMISKWLESAANFKPSEDNYLNWTYEMNEKKYKKPAVNAQQHGREELDAAEALTTLANAHSSIKY